MTTKHFLFCFLLFIQLAAFGQVKLSKDFLVSVGKPYKVVDAKSKEYFSDGKGFTVSVKTDGEVVTLQRYEIANMKEVNRKEYEDFPDAMKLQKVLKMGDRLFYIFSSFNKKEKKEDIYSREVNMADATFQPAKLLFSTASEVAVSSYGEIASMSWVPMGMPIRFEVYKSFDNSKLLIRYRLKPEERDDSKNYDVIGFYVFDAKLDKLWGGEVKMPYTEKVMNNLAYGVTKDGNAFMLAYINSSKRIELLNITKDLKVKANKTDVNGELMFQELKLRETVDGNLACIGYYANGIDYKFSFGGGNLSFNTNGILVFKIDQNGKLLENYNFEFPIDLINQYESKRDIGKNEKREDKGKAGIRDIKLIDLSLNDDGTVIVVGEQQYIVTSGGMMGVGMGTSQKNTYYYGDVIATKFDKTGKLIWMKKLPKTQLGYAGKGGMSIKYMKGKTSSYVLYLDNVKNANISMDEVPKEHVDQRGGYLTAYKLDDATGAIEKHSIFDITDIKGTEAYQFRTSRIFDAFDKVFMLEVYIKGKEDTMIMMELTK